MSVQPFLRRLVGRHATLAAALGLGVLLGVLAVLQYRWIGEVSGAERERLRVSFGLAGAGLSEDLDRELTRVFLNFVGGPPGGGRRGPAASAAPAPASPAAAGERQAALAGRLRRWRTQSPYPQLVRDVFVTEKGSDAALALRRLDPASERFGAVAWPAALEPLHRKLVAGLVEGKPLPSPLDGEAMALVFPLAVSLRGRWDGGEEGFVVVQLDRRYLVGQFLPELANRWFGLAHEPQVLLAVAGPEGLLYRSDPSLPAARYLPGDLSLPCFGLHRMESLHGLLPNPGLPGPPGSPEADLHRHSRPPGRDGRGGHHRPSFGATAWHLVITHRAGSLEAAVSRARWRNLGVSFGVLAFLAASLAVLALSTQRAQRLARQQMELVAGITHELNTPLAAIRSAGQNLADGVVAQAEQVRRYGVLIEREGARLSTMVGKALELAGIQSGQRVYRPEAVGVTEVVEEVLADLQFLLEERGITVERQIPGDLPAVWIDRAAFRMAVANLADNAVKHAGGGLSIVLRAAAERAGRQVSLTVEDRGPGIPAADRPRLFEPFYRGQALASGGVPGSGLGLSLVRRIAQAHRGTVSFAAGAGGRGSAFTLRLPAVAAAAGLADDAMTLRVEEPG